MDLDKAFVSALVRGGLQAFRSARDRGIDTGWLAGEGAKAYTFVSQYCEQYGTTPSLELVQGKTGVTLPSDATDSHEFLIEEIVSRQVHYLLREGVSTAVEDVQALPPAEALHKLEQLVRNVRKVSDSLDTSVMPLTQLYSQVLDFYDRVKRGERGVLSPWPQLNEDTYGFWPEDLVLFTARSGIGKSWVIVLQAHCCWKAGKRVLVCSPEMSRLRLAMRLAAIDMNLPYDDFRKGKLGEFQEQSFRRRVEELQGGEDLSAPFVIGGDTFDFRLDTYAAALREVKADLGILDGAYLMLSEGGDRVERAQNTFNMLKRVCKQTKIPTLVTTQLNRQAKVNSPDTVDLSTVAQTDASGWNADVVYALIQTDDMKRDRVMQFKPLKVREGVGRVFESRWDYEEMNFSEIERQGEGGGGGDPFAVRQQVKNPDAEVDF